MSIVENLSTKGNAVGASMKMIFYLAGWTIFYLQACIEQHARCFRAHTPPDGNHVRFGDTNVPIETYQMAIVKVGMASDKT